MPTTVIDITVEERTVLVHEEDREPDLNVQQRNVEAIEETRAPTVEVRD